jgi:ribonuclease HI
MSVPAPHFLLFSAAEPSPDATQPGEWRFVLEAVDGDSKIEVADCEPQMRGERLELLAVVRGLEALQQPSRVTLLTPSRYVARGITSGLNDWRDNDWQWEHHGAMVPIKNRDLWQRIDRALEFHYVECRQWRLDEQHQTPDLGRTRMIASPLTARRSDRWPDAEQSPGEDDRHVPTSRAIAVAAAGSSHSDSPRLHTAGDATSVHRAAQRHAARVLPARISGRLAFRGRRLRSLRIRRGIIDWLSAAWIRFRQLAAPLVKAPWLD